MEVILDVLLKIDKADGCSQQTGWLGRLASIGQILTYFRRPHIQRRLKLALFGRIRPSNTGPHVPHKLKLASFGAFSSCPFAKNWLRSAHFRIDHDSGPLPTTRWLLHKAYCLPTNDQ
jgi:hypothetical protein